MWVAIKSFRLFLTVTVSVVMTGCVFFNPYVEGNRDDYNKKPDIENALNYAQSTRAAYRKAIGSHSKLNISSGLIVAGTATAAAVAALSGVSNETLMRIGIGGASVYAVNGFLYNPVRQQIYTAGAKSLTCGIAVFEPLRTVDFACLKLNLGDLQRELAILQVKVNEANAKNPLSLVLAKLVQAENVLASAKVTLQRGVTVLQTPAKLMTFVDGVNDEVTAALQKAEPDVSTLVNSLGTAIPANAGLIASLPAPDPAEQIKKFSIDSDLEAALVATGTQALKVRNVAGTVEILIAGVVAPQASSLAACREFLQTGPFRVFPQPSVIIDTSQAEPSADIVVTGGTLPHVHAWLGQTPPKGVTLTEKAGPAGTILQVKAPTGTPGTYQLLVQDKGGNSAALLVSFVGGSGDAPAPATQPALQQPSTASDRDPEVKKIQEHLVALGCLAPKNEAGDTNIVGIWGARTTKAYNAFAEGELGGSAAAEATIGKLGDAGFFDKLINLLKTAVDNNSNVCGNAN